MPGMKRRRDSIQIVIEQVRVGVQRLLDLCLSAGPSSRLHPSASAGPYVTAPHSQRQVM
jgi:hypothetical protein